MPVLPEKMWSQQNLSIGRRHGNVASIGRIISKLVAPPIRQHLITENLPAHLLTWIDRQDCVAGCIAWLTRREIMAALHRRRCVTIVVQKEEYVQRFATMATTSEEESIYTYYQATNPGTSLPRYRAYGNMRQRSQGRTVMHHKFLVGYSLEFRSRSSGPVFFPTSVWYGSWNFTRGSSNNCDSAMIIDDVSIAEQCLREWWRIWWDSDPLTAD